MSCQLLNGKQLAIHHQQQLAKTIQRQREKGHRAPHLAVILVGHDPASTIYVKNKHLACQAIGITSAIHHFESSTTTATLLAFINTLNTNSDIDGILVQLPLPSHIDKHQIVESIKPQKDVDGFHPYNLGRLAQQNPLFRPCTPAGVMTLLNKTDKKISSLKATVIGTSDIVGKPMVLELLMANCTVTVCHSLTHDLRGAVEQAELIVSAVGKPNLIAGSWIQTGAIVIDVGINRMDNGTLVGDVQFEEATKRASWITPVPGGVGPMTVAMLLENTFQAYTQSYLHQMDGL